MNRKKCLPKACSILLSLLLDMCIAGEIVVIVDFFVVLAGKVMPYAVFGGIFFILVAAMALLKRFTWKHKLLLLAAVPACVLLVMLIGYGAWWSFSSHSAYVDVDFGKEEIYAERRVMVIVPHQDDEINILGGVMEEYLKYGSELYCVFVTNGDYTGVATGKTRIQEAVDMFASLGVPEENVIFLGYGDQWAEGGPHIYNAQPGTVLTSHAGQTATYGTAQHPAYREGRSYTIDHLLEDLEDVILEYRPDVIFCSDYDDNVDHRATSLLFEKVMGKILKDQGDYHPAVYKGYAYGYAWFAKEDFHNINILSTVDAYMDGYVPAVMDYDWDNRVRFPICASTVSRSIVNSKMYESLGSYASQTATASAERIINGDRVFWQRDTNSLCYQAEIKVSSGEGDFLNDFMLRENNNLMDWWKQAYGGVWIPAAEDENPKITVTLREASDISSVVLYDHPSAEHNILNAVLMFDDGSRIETGSLASSGTATQITVDKNDVKWFSVTVTSADGSEAGLAELEAYAEQEANGGKLIKLMDENSNFIYDYCIDSGENAVFSVYTYGNTPEVSKENYVVSIDNENCMASMEAGTVRVYCPTGEEAVLTITCEEENVSDSVFVRNPGKRSRLWIQQWQKAEEFVRKNFVRGGFAEKQPNLVLCRLSVKLWNFWYRMTHG